MYYWAGRALGSLIEAVTSPASPDVLQIPLDVHACVLLLIPLTNCFACMTRTQFISKVAPLFAVTQRRFSGHDFSLGWVLENLKPSTLQERPGQAATEEMQTGGLSLMGWLTGMQAPRGWIQPADVFHLALHYFLKISCLRFATTLRFHLLVPSPH